MPGVGKKTAERLVVELKDKLVAIPVDQPAQQLPESEAAAEAKLALVAWGYRPAEAHKVLEQVYRDDEPVEELIRMALQRLAATA